MSIDPGSNDTGVIVVPVEASTTRRSVPPAAAVSSVSPRSVALVLTTWPSISQRSSTPSSPSTAPYDAVSVAITNVDPAIGYRLRIDATGPNSRSGPRPSTAAGGIRHRQGGAVGLDDPTADDGDNVAVRIGEPTERRGW